MADLFQTRLARRAVFALAAGVVIGASGLASAAGLPIRAIRVSGTADRDLARIAPMVARELAHQLGQRYAPGAKGGAVLTVELDTLDLAVSTGGGGGGGGGGRHRWQRGGANLDVLEGQIAVIGAKGAALQQFPLMAQTTAIDSSDWHADATDNRLGSLAYTYSYWIISKLD